MLAAPKGVVGTFGRDDQMALSREKLNDDDMAFFDSYSIKSQSA